MIASYIIRFMAYSLLGWLYECTYCTIKTKHWMNRGFLFGPVCPIYGAGAVAATVLFQDLAVFGGTEAPVWKIFLICAAGSAVLEYVTSWVLERSFHAVWWDYSDVPLNVNGRICLPATLGFGAAGVLIVRFLLPFIASLGAAEAHPVLEEILSLFLMFLLGADLALTVASLSHLLAQIEEAQEEFNAYMENGVARIGAGIEAGKDIVQQGPTAMAQAARRGMTQAAARASRGVTARTAGIRRALTAMLRSRSETLGLRERHHLSAIREFRHLDKESPVLRLYKKLHGNAEAAHREHGMKKRGGGSADN